MRRLAQFAFPLLLLVTLACGSSPTAPSVTNVHSCAGGTITGSMSADVDGVHFVATCLDAASFVKGIVGFGGTNVALNNLTTYIDIAMAIAATVPGTFQVTATSANNASLTIGGAQWHAGAGSAAGGSGTIVINTLSATGVSGTFDLTLVAGPGGTGTKSVTSGKFNITF